MSVRLPISEPAAFDKDPRSNNGQYARSHVDTGSAKSPPAGESSAPSKESGSGSPGGMLKRIFGKGKQGPADDERRILSDTASLAETVNTTASKETGASR